MHFFLPLKGMSMSITLVFNYKPMKNGYFWIFKQKAADKSFIEFNVFISKPQFCDFIPYVQFEVILCIVLSVVFFHIQCWSKSCLGPY